MQSGGRPGKREPCVRAGDGAIDILTCDRMDRPSHRFFNVLCSTLLVGTMLCSCSTRGQPRDAGEIGEYPTVRRNGKTYKIVPNEDILMREEVATPLAPVCDGTSIHVNLEKKRAWLYRDGVLVQASAICSGRAGSETPEGRFRVISKHRDWVSTLYHVPMPHFLRLDADGGRVGLHAGPIALEPASRGCIRLPSKMAELFFKETSVGSTVVVRAGRGDGGTGGRRLFSHSQRGHKTDLDLVGR